jgi:hypothetical protein
MIVPVGDDHGVLRRVFAAPNFRQRLQVLVRVVGVEFWG